ncbi:MAG: PKD domain-containing protein, partial [bacterium]
MKRYLWLATLMVAVSSLLILSLLSSSDEQVNVSSSSPPLPSMNTHNNKRDESGDTAVTASASVTKPASFSNLPNELANYAALPSVAQAPKTLPDALESFNQWRKQKPANNNLDELNTWQVNGVQLAQARQVEMQRLMRQHPEYAITQALSFPDYDALPDEVKAHVEQPFSATVNFDVLPQESKRAFHLANKSYIRVDDPSSSGSNIQQKQYWQAYRYGARETILSKQTMVVQGIRLGDETVIHEQAIMPIAANDLAYVKQHFPLAKKHQTEQNLRDFFTNELIRDEPQFALAGGQLLAFSSQANIQRLNAQLAALEQKNHPRYSSALLFEERAAQLMSSMSVTSTQAANDDESLEQQLIKLLALPSDWTTSVKKVLLIRVKPSDATEPAITQTALETALNNSSVLIAKLSQNKTSLSSTVSAQDFTLSETAAYYAANDADVILDEAKQLFSAANPNVDLTTYDVVGVHIGGKKLPKPDVTWAGLASVGGSNYWLNNTVSLGVVTHEFGHIYGLSHANFWDTNNNSVIGSGSSEEYGDIYDIMGSGGAPEGYFHPQALEKIQWLTANDWIDVTTSGTYRVHRFDDENASGLRGLRISRNNGADGYYWLGHRQNYDNNATLENGAYLIWQQPNKTQGWLLDTTPGSFANNKEDKQDAGVKIGQTYSDSAADIHITTLAKGGTAPNEWLDIQVNLGNVSNQAPTVSLTLPNTLTARTDLTFVASANDSDGDTLAYAWDFGDGVIHPSQASVTQSWVVGGTYTVNVTVSDMKGGTATAQQTITVTDPLAQWHDRASPTNNHIVDIAANDTMAIAITDHAVLGSSDGETWTTLDERRDGNTGLGYNTYLRSIIYDVANQQWIAVGQDHNGGWVGAIYTSSDGTNWMERYLGGQPLRAIASFGSALVAVGDGGYAVRSSDGGATWSPVSTGISTALIDISYGNGQFIAVGNKYIVGHQAAVLTSSDGQSWSNQTNISGSGANNGFRRIAYLNNQFIASGYNSKLSYLTNSAGINFVTTRADREPTDALMYGASIYFAAGINQDGSGKDINLISLDGQTWTESPLSTDLDDRNAGVFFKNTFITVGENGSIRQSDPITPVVAPVDTDNDTIPDATDNCPNNANTDQADADNDGVGDVCDSTPNGDDSDSDTIPDATDNCPNDANTDQADLDNDNIGDVCDDDRDGDTVNNTVD